MGFGGLFEDYGIKSLEQNRAAKEECKPGGSRYYLPSPLWVAFAVEMQRTRGRTFYIPKMERNSQLRRHRRVTLMFVCEPRGEGGARMAGSRQRRCVDRRALNRHAFNLAQYIVTKHTFHNTAKI